MATLWNQRASCRTRGSMLLLPKRSLRGVAVGARLVPQLMTRGSRETIHSSPRQSSKHELHCTRATSSRPIRCLVKAWTGSTYLVTLDICPTSTRGTAHDVLAGDPGCRGEDHGRSPDP